MSPVTARMAGTARLARMNHNVTAHNHPQHAEGGPADSRRSAPVAEKAAAINAEQQRPQTSAVGMLPSPLGTLPPSGSMHRWFPAVVTGPQISVSNLTNPDSLATADAAAVSQEPALVAIELAAARCPSSRCPGADTQFAQAMPGLGRPHRYMGAAPNPRILTGWFGASSHGLRFPRRAFLRFPVCPPGLFPFVRLPPVSLRPAFSGSVPSAVAVRFGFPPGSLPLEQPSR